MSDLPFVDTAKAKTQQAKQQARQLISWLPDPYECPDCDRLCTAEYTYDPQTAAFHPGGMAPSWVCPSCGSAFRREEPWH